MYENKTFDVILADLLSRIPSTINKAEGSLVYNAVAPLAYELEKAYIQLDYILAETFMGTCTDYALAELRGRERNVIPIEATHAVAVGEFNVDVPIGARFSLNAFNYVATEKLVGPEYSEHAFKMMCEETGAKPNTNFGTLIPITFVEGLESAELTELLIAGADKESLESYKERYFKTFETLSFGGNQAYYKQFTNAIDGVGGTKVYPVWDGPNTVKLVIIASDYSVPSDELVEIVQDAVCPVPFTGEGIAPIGHDVTVASVDGVTVDIVSHFTFDTGYNFNICKPAIENAIEEYLGSLRGEWSDTDHVTIYISQLESHILDVEGILDVSNTTVNGSSSSVALDSDEVPVFGEVSQA